VLDHRSSLTALQFVGIKPALDQGIYVSSVGATTSAVPLIATSPFGCW
jgi:hypothetical protein